MSHIFYIGLWLFCIVGNLGSPTTPPLPFVPYSSIRRNGPKILKEIMDQKESFEIQLIMSRNLLTKTGKAVLNSNEK